MSKHQATDVFTPTKPARLTFVERQRINDRLVDSLRTPGKQVVVYGPSGSGKTTLLVNKLDQLYERHVTVRCTEETTFPHVIARAMDQLDAYYGTSRSMKLAHGIGANLGTEFARLKAALQIDISKESHETTSRAVPIQLTAERVAEFLGAVGACLLLEDFHKLAAKEKVKVAQAMKVFMDMADSYSAVRLVLIGAVNTARQVVEYDAEMQNRVSEIHVPLMNESEVREILSKGEEILNVHFPGALTDEIARYAGGIAAVAHQLGLNFCFAAGVVETCDEQFLFTNKHLDRAMQRYIDDSSDTLKAIFDRALKRTRTRKYDNCRLILRALADRGAVGGSHGELLSLIRSSVPEYPSGNLTTYLKQLQTSARGEVVRFDPDSNRYSFSDPLYLTYALLTLSEVDRRRRLIAGDERQEFLRKLTRLIIGSDKIMNRIIDEE